VFLQDAVSTRRQVSPKRLSFLAAYFALALGAMAGLAGCGQAPAEGMAMPPPAVTVSYPIERDVVDYNDFTGRTAAVDSVKVRARVWGYLHKINFTEGAEVNKDDVLFEIDPRPYEARLDRLDSDYRRAASLLARRAISQEDYDHALGDRKEAVAAVGSARANRDTARLNLDFTKVRAPISGRVSRAMVTVGNLIESGETGGTVLTTIVSLDPMYVYFDVDDLTFQLVRQVVRDS